MARLTETELAATRAGGVPPAASAGDNVFAVGAQGAARYRIARPLHLISSARGMGEVYEAHDLVLGERVALKAIRRGRAYERAVERFRTEVQLARRVTHPNILPHLRRQRARGRRLPDHGVPRRAHALRAARPVPAAPSRRGRADPGPDRRGAGRRGPRRRGPP